MYTHHSLIVRRLFSVEKVQCLVFKRPAFAYPARVYPCRVATHRRTCIAVTNFLYSTRNEARVSTPRCFFPDNILCTRVRV